MFKAILLGALAVSAETQCLDDAYGNFLDEECYCGEGEIVKEDFSGCVKSEDEGRRLNGIASRQAFNQNAVLVKQTQSKLGKLKNDFQNVRRMGLSGLALDEVASRYQGKAEYIKR